METVLLTGGSGLIASHLSKLLINKGYNVILLSRKLNQSSTLQTYLWNPEEYKIDKEAILQADYIINLAGANIGDNRWTNARKTLIISSRIQAIQLLYSTVIDQNIKVKAFISSSAIGYYGTNTSDKIYDEEDKPATDFLGLTCQKWEQAADQFSSLGVRVVKVRSGIVLARDGAMLPKICSLVRYGLGTVLGNGKQYVPWIHIDDICGIYIKAVEDSSMQGAYNAVAPDEKTNKEFTYTLARILRRPILLPFVPGFVLRLVFGSKSSILLQGSRVSAKKIQNAGYKFQYSVLKSALQELCEI